MSMGHVVNSERAYRLLQQQMDHNVSGAPETPAIMKILKLLYSPEEADFARQLPTHPKSLPDLARRLDMPEDELRDKLTDLARRGLVLDIERKGQRYYALPPVLGGIFEFVLMRTRDDLPIEELSRLFDEYMNGGEVFPRAAYAGETQFARAFVHEDALPLGDHTEILDWERVSKIIDTASCISIALCPCRHRNRHLGKACGAPERTCISLNGGAEAMIHSDISERIDAKEALRIVEESRRAGLAQCGDNVQRHVTFLCNCCGCCCTMLHAMRTFNLRHAIMSSNWIAESDSIKCKACGKCAKACPAGAISMEEHPPSPPSKGEYLPSPPQGDRMEVIPARVERTEVLSPPVVGTGISPSMGERQRVSPFEGGQGGCSWIDDTVCLGCGVCYTMCRSGAIRMRARAQRVFTPENAFDKTVRMAIERGKLADLLFEDPERLSHRAVGRVVHILEKTPPWKAAMAVKPLRSAFLNRLIRAKNVAQPPSAV